MNILSLSNPLMFKMRLSCQCVRCSVFVFPCQSKFFFNLTFFTYARNWLPSERLLSKIDIAP